MNDKTNTAGRIEKRELCIDEELYHDALRLRYTVFFEPHGLEYNIVLDELERSSRHFALVEDQYVVAYARLTFIVSGEAKISQMVVLPARQGLGFGSILLGWIIEVCEGEQIERVVLEARATKMEFYMSHGFRCCGTPYPSQRTGLPHVHMERIFNFSLF